MRLLRSALVPVCAALCSAVVAHLAIDVAGDHLLAHDTYDDVAHGSRSIAALFAFALVICVSIGVAYGALREARGSEDAFRRSLATLLPRNGPGFAVIVACLAPVMLLGMEFLDSAVTGQPAQSALDLFGGSIALGVTLSLCSSLAVAAIAWNAIRFLARKRRCLVAFAVVLLRCSRSLLSATLLGRRCRTRITTHHVAHGRHCIGRAPPAFPLVAA